MNNLETPYYIRSFWSPDRQYLVTVHVYVPEGEDCNVISLQDDNAIEWEPVDDSAHNITSNLSVLDATLAPGCDELDTGLGKNAEHVRAILHEQPNGQLTLASDFGDPETLMNSRNWLSAVVEAKGAKVVGAGCGMGQADIDIMLEGHKFNLCIRPI